MTQSIKRKLCEDIDSRIIAFRKYQSRLSSCNGNQHLKTELKKQLAGEMVLSLEEFRYVYQLEYTRIMNFYKEIATNVDFAEFARNYPNVPLLIDNRGIAKR